MKLFNWKKTKQKNGSVDGVKFLARNLLSDGRELFFQPKQVKYQIVIENPESVSKTAMLFGANRYLLSDNFGSDEGLKITSNELNVEYSHIIQQVTHEPVETSLIRVQSSNASQVTQIINYEDRDSNGQYVGFPIITQSYFSVYQQQSGILDVPYNLILSGNTFLAINILPKTTVVFTFFCERQISLSKKDLINLLKELGIKNKHLDKLIKRAGIGRKKQSIWSKLKSFFSFKWTPRSKKKTKMTDDAIGSLLRDKKKKEE